MSPPSAPPREVFTVLDTEGRADPATDPHLDLALIERIYRGMLRTRLIDERLTRLQRQGRVGFHVGALGEEAAIVASAAALRPHDWIFPCYREVGAALYRGLSLQTYVDNMYGNANDLSRGRQMPDHVTARAQNFVSITAPIGTQITQAVGCAWAAKIKREDLVTACFFGDGATSSNDFHSGMTFAGAFHTPTIFLLRNNGWAISLPSDKQTGARAYCDKGPGYGVAAVRCDGNDALAVYATVQQAVQRAVRGEGPTLVELMTYRAGAHSTSDDPGAYRGKDEEARWAARDPIARLRKHLELRDGWSQAREEQFVASVQEELQTCIAAAEKTPPPSIESMFEQVYATMPEHLAEQQQECVAGPRARKKH